MYFNISSLQINHDKSVSFHILQPTCIILLQERHMTLPVELLCSFFQVSQVLDGQTIQHQLLVPRVQADPNPGHLWNS